MKNKYRKKQLSSNIWKFFIYKVSHRRHFIPLLAIYFLTLPNTNAQQIGIYTGIAFLASFIIEIPSGYFADRFGHKKTLILAKILAILSLISFIHGNSLPFFILGSTLMSMGFAFDSGTSSAFMHNTLIELKREKEYIKIMSKTLANVSLASAVLVILLPLFTKISIKLPFKINLFFDIIGLLVVISFKSPKQNLAIAQKSFLSFWNTIKKSAKPGFYTTSLYLGALGGFMFGISAFRVPYLVTLGLPIIFVGAVMSLSRVFWFLIGHKAHILEEKFGVRRLLKFDPLIFPLLFLFTAIFDNPYIVGLIFSLITGYYWGRNQIITNHFLSSFITDPRYKATMLSVKNQIQIFYQFIVAFAAGFFMKISYKLGFTAVAVSLLIILLSLYHSLRKIR